MHRKRMVYAVLVAGLLAGTAAFAQNGTPINPNANNVLTLAVYGDSPYGTTPTDTSQTDATLAFISTINADPKVDLVLHVGDIHSGKQFCTEAYDRQVYGLWQSFKDPLIYSPGDNEWSDCHKVAEGGGAYNSTTHVIDYVKDAHGNLADYAGGDPIANLQLVRSIFYAQPGYSLGGRKKQVLSQQNEFDSAFPSDAQFVENVMWEQSKVLFVTINLPGGSNNDNDIWYGAPAQSQAQKDEISQRTAADLRWLEAAFSRAIADEDAAVVIQAQADVWDPEKGASHQNQYAPIVNKIAQLALVFGKPVLEFNGDSHVYRSDNPLSPTAPCTWENASACPSVYNIQPLGWNVPNFHRIVVHGSTAPMEWLRLTINPSADVPADTDPFAFGPFRWERMVTSPPLP